MRARSLSRASARPLGGEGSKATDRARGLGDSPDVLRAAQGCSHLRCRAVPGRARRRGAACSPPRGHCQCGGDRPGIGRASPWESGQCSRPPRARPLAEPREGRGIPCARWLLPTRGTRSTACTRGKCTVGHRPLLSTVQTTPCASRGAGSGGAARRPPARGREPTPHDTHHAPHPPQRSIAYSYNEFTNKTLHTRTALQVNRYCTEPCSEASGESRETRSRPTRAHASGVNMPPWPFPEQVDVRIVPEARTHEAAYASEQQPHRRAPPTGCAHPVASKQLPSRTP